MRITFAPTSGSRECPRASATPTTTSLEPWREPLAEPLPAPPHPADREALALKAARERVIIPLARAARAFIRARGWTRYGYARLSDFGMEVLDHSSRSLTDLGSLAWSLERLPRLRSALTGEDGGRPLGQVAATLVGRVAGRDSLPAWIALARSVPVRELREQAAAARQRGSMWPPGAEPAANDALPPGPPPSTFSSGVPGDFSTSPTPSPRRNTVRLSRGGSGQGGGRGDDGWGTPIASFTVIPAQAGIHRRPRPHGRPLRSSAGMPGARGQVDVGVIGGPRPSPG